jgi:peptide/nickel transport system substrate-binding protein
VPEASTRVAMLKTGQVDLADVSLDDVKELRASGFKIASDPQPTSVRIHLYGSYYDNAGPIGKLEVRKALNLAINRQEMVDALFLGQGEPAAVFPVSKLSIGYPKGLKPYPYDPAEARRLLARAGYPNGFPIKLYTVATGGFAQHSQVTEVVAGYWEAIGLKTEIVPTDMGTFRPLYIKQPQDPEIVGHASVFATTPRLDGATELGIWWSKQRKILQLAGNVDEYYAKTQMARSVEEIDKLVNDAFHIIYNDYRGVPLADVNGIIWALGNQAAGVTVTPHRGYLHPSLAAVTAK